MASLEPTTAQADPTDRADRANAAAAAALVVMWSSGFIGAELGTRTASADTLLVWRYILGAAILLVWAWSRGMRVTRGAVWREGVVGVLTHALYLAGVVTSVAVGVPAGIAALVAALQPLLVGALAGSVLGQHTTRLQWWGLGVGFAGVVLVVADDVRVGSVPWWGYLLPAGGMLAISAGTLMERRWRSPVSLLDAFTIHVVVTAVLFVAETGVAGRLAPPADPDFWWAVAWILVLSMFGGQGLYLFVLRRGGATRVSTLMYLTPPTTMLWAFLMFGQRPGWLSLVGVVVCAVAVRMVLATRPQPMPAGQALGCGCGGTGPADRPAADQ
ncbi:MAG: EamA family transporter [Propionibacteriales bacterium]|nr:EamA family transporter [Propionibacteriales bacterium]